MSRATVKQRRVLGPTFTSERETIRTRSGDAFRVRPDTHDAMIITEIYGPRGYSRRLRIEPGDTVLDIGAHIGTFSVRSSRIAGRVVAFEPDPGNAELLRENIARNALGACVIEMHERAVVGNDDQQRTLHVSPEGRTSASSFHVRRGRKAFTVQCSNINTVMKRYRPTVLKIDCEGAEDEIVAAMQDWSGVREVAMEYHVSMLRDQDLSRYHRLLAVLDDAFPIVRAPRHHSGAWTRDVYASRR